MLLEMSHDTGMRNTRLVGLKKKGKVILRRLERDIFPNVWAKPIKEEKASESLAAVKLIASRVLWIIAPCLAILGRNLSLGHCERCGKHNIISDLH
jgi:hypothetical protein